MEISKQELWVLSYYRASELAGALLFGRLARRTEDDELRVFLTEHFAQEASHAWVWTETIRNVGGAPLPILDTYQSAYAREIGIPSTMFEVLLLTEVFEQRVFRHFTAHAARKGLHPTVRATLDRMLDEEREHVGWVTRMLEALASESGIDLPAERARYHAIDERIYDEVSGHEAALWEYLES